MTPKLELPKFETQSVHNTTPVSTIYGENIVNENTEFLLNIQWIFFEKIFMNIYWMIVVYADRPNNNHLIQ